MTVKPLKITEVALRDAHQSLFATRMRTESMLPIASRMDEAGYWSVEMWGGATFDTCVRFLNEDPWERVRALKKLMPKTPFQMLLRGQNLVGYRHYADDMVEKFVDLSCEAGIDIFRIFDALNDLRNIKTAVDRVRRNGRHVQGAICYTTSPLHNVPFFLQMARELEGMGVDSICIKDMAGLLAPAVAAELVSGMKNTLKVPVHLHTHTTSGYALMSITRAIEAGLDGVDTAISSLSLGSSHSPTETIVSAMSGTERDTGIDIGRLAPIAYHFGRARKEYASFDTSFQGVDTSILISQVPGGMLSNLEAQLKTQNALNRLAEVLVELPRCRKDMGYPPLVTPTSQIVGAQAVLNVLMGRYKIISKETRDLVEGRYGRLPGPVDADLRNRVLAGRESITVRPADLIEPEWEKVRASAGKGASDEDAMVCGLFPQLAEQYMKVKGAAPESNNNRNKTANPAVMAAQASRP